MQVLLDCQVQYVIIFRNAITLIIICWSLHIISIQQILDIRQTLFRLQKFRNDLILKGT